MLKNSVLFEPNFLDFPEANHSEVWYPVIMRWPFGVWTAGKVGTGSLNWEVWQPPVDICPCVLGLLAGLSSTPSSWKR